MLDYQDYRNFQSVIEKARTACAQSGFAPSDHFGDVTGMVTIGSGAQRARADRDPRRLFAGNPHLASRRIGLAATTVILAATMVIAFAAPI